MDLTDYEYVYANENLKWKRNPKNYQDLKSGILVERLLKENKDLFIIYNQIRIEILWFDSHNSITEQEEQDYIDYEKRDMLDDYPEGLHCGDCIQMSCGCNRCFIEDICLKAVKYIKEWNSLDIQDKSISKLLEILIATEYLNYDYNQTCCSINFREMTDKDKQLEQLANELGDQYENVKYRYELWNSFTDIDKNKAKERAHNFINYILI